ncbi:hypothetical protein CPB84DRAFT_1962251 [Gymnopilus junonius]|uniref:Uncharacterized protein n=1 Tax=Gymnopilus junonius TaxID=109634 RepID=A0A9P5NPZ6_GYMJU|nr:hypothetical protein CPB84DRAFT_1962251 [Gymnopilus junonius]
MEDEFSTTLSNILTWNPEIVANCSNLLLGLSTSTGPPANVAPGTITDGCLEDYTVVSDNNCSVTKDNNLQLGLAYCVSLSTSTGPSSNVVPGKNTDGCTQYYTVVSGDT